MQRWWRVEPDYRWARHAAFHGLFTLAFLCKMDSHEVAGDDDGHGRSAQPEITVRSEDLSARERAIQQRGRDHFDHIHLRSGTWAA